MKPGQLDTAIKTELGHINTMFHWFINLKMNVDYKTTLICEQPILDCMVPYLIDGLINTSHDLREGRGARAKSRKEEDIFQPHLEKY